MARIRILLTVAALAFVGRAAAAADFVVVEADGIRLPTGQSVNGAQPLKLEDGQAVTLLSQDGQTIHIDGPSSAAPDSLAKGGSADVPDCDGSAHHREPRPHERGRGRARPGRGAAARSLGRRYHPPGHELRARRRGRRAVARPAAHVATVAFAPKDRSWNVSGTWPANADRVTLPANMPLKDDWDYVVEVGGGRRR